MPVRKSQSVARRRAWGRGPAILRFEPLEGRQLLSTSTATAPPGADLVATAFDTLHNLDWGDSFRAVGTIKNQGDADVAGDFTVDVFASPTQTPGANAVLVGSVPFTSGLQAGATASFDKWMSVPNQPIAGLGQSPTYFLTLKVNPDGKVAESNVANNLGRGQGYDASVVTVTPHLPSKLVSAGFSVAPGSVKWGDDLIVSLRVSNQAQGNAPATNARVVLTPFGKTPGGPFDLVLGSVPVQAVGAWQTAGISQRLQLPANPPASLASFGKFNVSVIQDADGQANSLVSVPTFQGYGVDMAALQIAPVAVTAPKAPQPDVSFLSLTTPSPTINWGDSFQVSTTVANTGPADAGDFKLRFYLTESDAANAPSLPLGEAMIPGVKSGYTQDVSQTLQLPTKVPAGLAATANSGRVVVKIDPDGALEESNVGNNKIVSQPIQLRVVSPDPQSTVGQTTTPASGNSTATDPTAPATTTGGAATSPDPASAATSSTTATTTTTTTTTATATTTTTAIPVAERSTAKHAKVAKQVALSKRQLRHQQLLKKLQARKHKLAVFHPQAPARRAAHRA